MAAYNIHISVTSCCHLVLRTATSWADRILLAVNKIHFLCNVRSALRSAALVLLIQDIVMVIIKIAFRSCAVSVSL